MAKNLRSNDSKNDLKNKIVQECKRQFESCLYASVACYEWLKVQRCYQRIFIILQVALTNVGTWYILYEPSSNPRLQWLAAFCTLIGSLAFGIRKALKLDIHLDKINQSAVKYINLRDRFRQASEIYSHKTIEKFEEYYEQNMKEMEEARQISPAIPDKYLEKARVKIVRGDYNFEEDNKS